MTEQTEKRKVLTRDDILGAKDLGMEWVDVPEWGGGVYVKILTGRERDAWEWRTFRQKNKATTRASLVAECAVDENGNKLFSLKDVQELSEKSAVALDRVFEQAQKINGLAKVDVDAITKNLLEDQSEGFISD